MDREWTELFINSLGCKIEDTRADIKASEAKVEVYREIRRELLYKLKIDQKEQ